MTEGASKLLRELSLLLRRHPPEHFEELARLLGDPKFTMALASLLAELASVVRQHPPRRRASGRSDILETVRSADEKKYLLLREAQEKLFDKGLHGKLAHLVRAIESSGVLIPKKAYRRREEVILAFIQSASHMPTEELRQVLEKLGVARIASDLEGWSRLIVPKRDVPRGRLTSG